MVHKVHSACQVLIQLHVCIHLCTFVCVHFFLLSHLPQAPVSMKAVCQAAWLWTVAFGNLIVIIIAESSIFANQVSDDYCDLRPQ